VRLGLRKPALVAACGALLLLTAGRGRSEAQLGVNCTVTTGGVAFGSYDVFSPSALDVAGAVTYQCTIGVFIQIQLETGSAGSFAPRTLRSGAESLAYNLYLDAPRTTVWGNGSAGTSTHSGLVATVLPVSVPVDGRIPARQDATPGFYSDSVVTTIVF
jgi:spore coat protein U-like protein